MQNIDKLKNVMKEIISNLEYYQTIGSYDVSKNIERAQATLSLCEEISKSPELMDEDAIQQDLHAQKEILESIKQMIRSAKQHNSY